MVVLIFGGERGNLSVVGEGGSLCSAGSFGKEAMAVATFVSNSA